MTLYSCVLFWSMFHQVDHRITLAVISIESNGNPLALSPDRKDGGLMQIRIKYAPESRMQLFQSCTNVMRGTQLLKQAMRKCVHKLDNTWLVCYNAGVAGGRKIKHPRKFPYYNKIVSKL